MSFGDGHKKLGGRKSGTPNKRTLSLIEVLEKHGYSPIADLIEWASYARNELERLAKAPIIEDPTLDSEQKFKLMVAHANAAASKPEWVRIGVQCATGILPYVYPKRKPAEGDAEDDPSEINQLADDELMERAKKLLNELN
jgi:hypothetical protein